MESGRPSTETTIRPTTTRRPFTVQSRAGQSRPTTARVQTATSVHHQSSHVVAIFESRGVGHEVGIAALEKDTGRVILVQVHLLSGFSSRPVQLTGARLQLADGQTYVRTLHQMHLLNPSIIVVPDTFLSATDATSKRAPTASLLVQYLEEEFPDVSIEPAARKYWNEQTGPCWPSPFVLMCCLTAPRL
jgi:DNA mismatch repair protein MSH4